MAISFSERMAQAKDNAANARYRGKQSGQHRSWNYKRHYENRQDWARNQLYMAALRVGIEGEALIKLLDAGCLRPDKCPRLIKLLPEIKQYFCLINDDRSGPND